MLLSSSLLSSFYSSPTTSFYSMSTFRHEDFFRYPHFLVNSTWKITSVVFVLSLSWLTTNSAPRPHHPYHSLLEILNSLENSPKLEIMRKLITPLQYWLYLKFNYPLFLWIWFSRDYVWWNLSSHFLVIWICNSSRKRNEEAALTRLLLQRILLPIKIQKKIFLHKIHYKKEEEREALWEFFQ